MGSAGKVSGKVSSLSTVSVPIVCHPEPEWDGERPREAGKKVPDI